MMSCPNLRSLATTKEADLAFSSARPDIVNATFCSPGPNTILDRKDFPCLWRFIEFVKRAHPNEDVQLTLQETGVKTLKPCSQRNISLPATRHGTIVCVPLMNLRLQRRLYVPRLWSTPCNNFEDHVFENEQYVMKHEAIQRQIEKLEGNAKRILDVRERGFSWTAQSSSSAKRAKYTYSPVLNGATLDDPQTKAGLFQPTTVVEELSVDGLIDKIGLKGPDFLGRAFYDDDTMPDPLLEGLPTILSAPGSIYDSATPDKIAWESHHAFYQILAHPAFTAHVYESSQGNPMRFVSAPELHGKLYNKADLLAGALHAPGIMLEAREFMGEDYDHAALRVTVNALHDNAYVTIAREETSK